MLLSGVSREHISESLGITVSTVRQHIKNARRRLEAESLIDLIRIYVRTLDGTKAQVSVKSASSLHP